MKEKIIIEDSNNIKRFKAKLKKIYKKKKMKQIIIAFG